MSKCKSNSLKQNGIAYGNTHDYKRPEGDNVFSYYTSIADSAS